jgi:O-antigen/teichoic acid export membrane protein
LFAYGWRLHVSTVCTVLNRQFDKFLLARAAGLGSVATYEVAARAVGSVGTLQPYLAATLLPASSELHALDRIEDLRGLYRRSTSYLLLVGIPPFVFLASQSDAAITAWLGAPQPLAALFLLCLAPGYLVNTACNGMAFFCQGVGQPGIQARQSAWQLGINVVLSTLLLFAIGPLGAAIGTSIALIAGAIYFARHFHAHLGVSTWALLRESAAVPMLASFAGAALGVWAVAGSEAMQRGTALLQLGISGTLFSAVVAALYLASGQVGRVELRLLAGGLRPGGPARTA